MRRITLFIFLFLTSCSRLPIENPEISLTNILPEQVGLLETTFKSSIRISNPNDEAIKVSGGKHRLYINDTYLGSGLSNEEFVIESYQDKTINITINASNIQMARELQAMLNSQKFSYTIKSRIKTKYPAESLSQKEYILELENKGKVS